MPDSSSSIGTWPARLGLVLAVASLAACGSATPGRMEWIQPHTTAPRVGTTILLRGWKGVFTPGIDEIARQISARGATALVYMPEQYPEIAATMVRLYKGNPDHEPICFVGHSRGADSALIIARELEKVDVPVDMIVCLDSVDEIMVAANVRVCYNYWKPGLFGQHTNLFRGLPLVQAPGATGKLHNYNLSSSEYDDWHGPLMEHIGMSRDSQVQQCVVRNILEVCVERSLWKPPTALR